MTDDVRKKPGLLGRLFGRDASVPIVADEPVLVAVVEPRLSWWQKLKQGLARSSSSIGQGITDLFTKRKLDSGTLEEFDLPLLPLATPRGEALRSAIVAIPVGETLSYGALARIAGSAPRAIGQACARNVFPIIVPCHRVIGSGGAIGHYSGGSGITTKRWLLDHERRGGLL